MNKTLGAIIAATVLSAGCGNVPQKPYTPIHDQAAALDSRLENLSAWLTKGHVVHNPNDTARINLWSNQIYRQADSLFIASSSLKVTPEWKAEKKALAQYRVDSAAYEKAATDRMVIGSWGAIFAVFVGGLYLKWRRTHDEPQDNS